MLNVKEVFATLHYLSTVEEIDQDKFTLGGDAGLVVMGLKKAAPVLKVWLDSPEFIQMAKDKLINNHPMTDTVIEIEYTRCPPSEPILVEVRERNTYFPAVRIDGVNVLDVLTLMIQKRAEYSEAVATSSAREIVAEITDDLRALNDILAERNKVRQSA